MHLQKQLSKKYGDKEYAKYVIVIKSQHIEKLGWKDGDKLNATVKGKELIINKIE